MPINHGNDALFKDNLRQCVEVLIAVLEGILKETDPEFEIREMKFLDPESKASLSTKKSIQDLLVEITTTKGKWIVCGIEMQNYNEAICNRIFQYSFNLMSRYRLKEGEHYQDANIPKIMQIWFVKGYPEFFRDVSGYHFCSRHYSAEKCKFLPVLGIDLHFINCDYFKGQDRKIFEPKNDFEYVMMLFTCSTFDEMEEYIKQTGKIILQGILNNEKSFVKDDEKMEDYRMFEDLEAALASRNAEFEDLEAALAGRKAELERRTSELEQSKCQIKTLEEAVKAKDAEIQKANDRADAGIREANDRADKAEARIAELEAQLAAKSAKS